MTTLTQGSNARIAYIEEVTAGTTPATPEFSKFPITDFNLMLSKDVFTDPAIRDDRQLHYLQHGNYKVGGDFGVTLQALGADPTGNQLFDAFFESALNSTWTSNVLKVGQTQKNFTVEKTLTDQAGGQSYFRWKGVQITGFNFDVALNAPVKVKFNTVGLTEDAVATTAITGATYLDEPAGNAPLVHINASNFFKEGGVASSIMTGLTLNLTNNSVVNNALGSAGGVGITSGRAEITGTITKYYVDATEYNKFKNETETSVEFKLSDGTNSYTFLLPRVKYSTASQVVASEGTLLVTMNYTALFSEAEGSTLVITRA